MKLVGIILGIAAAIGVVIGIPYYNANTRQSNAESLAREWTAKMYPNQGVTAVCQGTDSDGDGYVSCTAKVGNERIPLDCHSYLYFSFGNTCREQLPALKKIR